mmetsp:Transcript_29849/g.77046  ORF Transcript_29849/g.77046 Transcript_29849/m.77046 type:complete len:264 (-) Transcript_29849:290-1081(-)
MKTLAVPITDWDVHSSCVTAKPKRGGHFAVGEVTNVGNAKSDFKKGDIVVALCEGTWSKTVACPSDRSAKVPEDVPLDAALGLLLGPVQAKYALGKAKLSVSSVVVVHGSCPVAQSLVLMASAQKHKVVSVIPVRPGEEEMREVMKQLGAELCVSEEFAKSEDFSSVLADLPKPAAILRTASEECAFPTSAIPAATKTLNFSEGKALEGVTGKDFQAVFDDSVAGMREGPVKVLLEKVEPWAFDQVVERVVKKESYRTPIVIV